jgi:DNA helicase II / ATP-dependent DNA helicase PcrA
MRTADLVGWRTTCGRIYSFTINSGKSLEQVLAENFPWCVEWEKELRRLFQSYTAAKQRQNVLDYDDLLLYWAEMMRDDNLAAEIGGRFDHILRRISRHEPAAIEDLVEVKA